MFFKKEMKLVITFTTTTQAMEAEKIFKEQGGEGRIIPVPKEITAGCGFAWCAKIESRDSLEEIMKNNGIKGEAIHQCMI